jgi:putative ABC transport system permease protein
MILQSFKMAVKSILTNKLRSFLTMLGIIIGVVSLVVLVSLVNGATGSITDTIDSLGNNLLTVMITDDHENPLKLSQLSEFTDDDMFELAAPTASGSVTASSSYAEETVNVTGTTASYSEIQGLELASGRFLMTPDVDNHTNVIVINADLATDVMGREDVVGETMNLDGKAYLIIGVLEEEDSSLGALTGSNYEAYIPYTSLIRLTDSVSLDVTSFCISVKGDDMDAAEDHLEELLLERFEDDEDAFSVFNQSSIAEAMDSVTGTLELLLGGIAGISLLVGGIGIMNIMLVSVTERTREIGIRKAIGAGRGTIMLQFLIEALMVSLIGCLLGIFLSWVVLTVINVIGDVSYSLSPGVTILSIVFSIGIGVIFGIYPASKAARKNPIEALRFN